MTTLEERLKSVGPLPSSNVTVQLPFLAPDISRPQKGAAGIEARAPSSEDEFLQRIEKWDAFMQRLVAMKGNPAIGPALVQLGAALASPMKPGENLAAKFTQGAAAATGTLLKGKALQQQQAKEAIGLAMEDERLQEQKKRTKLQEEELGLKKGVTELQKSRLSLELEKLKQELKKGPKLSRIDLLMTAAKDALPEVYEKNKALAALQMEKLLQGSSKVDFVKSILKANAGKFAEIAATFTDVDVDSLVKDMVDTYGRVYDELSKGDSEGDNKKTVKITEEVIQKEGGEILGTEEINGRKVLKIKRKDGKVVVAPPEVLAPSLRDKYFGISTPGGM